MDLESDYHDASTGRPRHHRRGAPAIPEGPRLPLLCLAPPGVLLFPFFVIRPIIAFNVYGRESEYEENDYASTRQGSTSTSRTTRLHPYVFPSALFHILRLIFPDLRGR